MVSQVYLCPLAGHDLENIDFAVMAPGTISGKVIDENREPMPGMTVYLISREYFEGSLGYFLKSSAITDDRGHYTLGAESGHAYMIAADRRDLKLRARSDAPLNAKLRRPVPMRTWYPNSPMPETAIPVTLRSGEHRDGVDIEMKKSPSYCIEGVITSPTGPAALHFTIEAQRPSSGISSGGGMYMRAPSGVTSADGKFRVCDLSPGTYRLSTVKGELQDEQLYAVQPITIGERDLQNLRLTASGGQPLRGEVVWDGEAPDKPVETKLSLDLEPLLRSHFAGDNTFIRTDIPSTFSFPSLWVDSHAIYPRLNAPGLYIKDITYSGRSVLHTPLQLGSAMGGAGLRVVIGHDGGTISARVADKDGNPLGDARIMVLPAEIASEAMLADVMGPGRRISLACTGRTRSRPGSIW